MIRDRPLEQMVEHERLVEGNKPHRGDTADSFFIPGTALRSLLQTSAHPSESATYVSDFSSFAAVAYHDIVWLGRYYARCNQDKVVHADKRSDALQSSSKKLTGVAKLGYQTQKKIILRYVLPFYGAHQNFSRHPVEKRRAGDRFRKEVARLVHRAVSKCRLRDTHKTRLHEKRGRALGSWGSRCIQGA